MNDTLFLQTSIQVAMQSSKYFANSNSSIMGPRQLITKFQMIT